MGRRGPAPKPTVLNELAGNPGKRAKNHAEPKPREGKVTCPSWLSERAKIEWRRIVPELLQLRLLTVVDRAALAAYCLAYAELQHSTEILESEGRILVEPVIVRDKATGERKHIGDTRKAHPAVKLQRDAFGRVKQFLAEFGLTPSSRSRLQVPAESGQEKDPFEALTLRAHDAG
jgi:P27 family predicted phage terminase small subunit